jgi:DNA-binding transcriptional LysR family regulator
MDLRQLRYFCAVVREGHFGRAAAALGIAQPPLSRQIQTLERQLGVELLHRTQKKFEVTQAGLLLYERARRLLDGADQAADDVRRLGSGETGRLTVGFAPSNAFTILPPIVTRFRSAYPDVELELQQLTTSILVTSLESGSLDVALLRPPLSSRSLQIVTLIREPFVALVPAAHRLAAGSAIQLRQFTGEPFVMYSRAGLPLLHARVMDMCRRANLSPRIVQYADQIYTVAGFVSAGLGVAVAPSTVTRYNMPGLRILPLAETPAPLAMAMAWRTGTATGLIRNFTRVAREAAAAWQAEQLRGAV